MKLRRGFALVELLVAITLGLIVLAALLSLFAGTRAANRSTTGISALTDSGRFALSFIAQTARGAGYYACNNPSRQTTVLNPAPTPLPYSFGNPVSGYEAVATPPGGALVLPARPAVPDGSAADWIGGIDALLVGRPVQGSDVLVLRSSLPRTGVAQGLPVYVTTIVDGANSFQVGAAGNLAAGQLAVISDCVKSVTFQISAFDGVNVFHDVAGMPGNAASALPISFSPGAEVMPITTTVYYIGVGADGDGALFSMDLNGTGTFAAPREIVPDIENMQVLYGFDITGNQLSYQYMTADQITNWQQVASIKVAVLASSAATAVQPPTGAPATFNLLGTTVTVPNDSRSRQTFDTTITLRNSVN